MRPDQPEHAMLPAGRPAVCRRRNWPHHCLPAPTADLLDLFKEHVKETQEVVAVMTAELANGQGLVLPEQAQRSSGPADAPAAVASLPGTVQRAQLEAARLRHQRQRHEQATPVARQRLLAPGMPRQSPPVTSAAVAGPPAPLQLAAAARPLLPCSERKARKAPEDEEEKLERFKKRRRESAARRCGGCQRRRRVAFR